jgi:predicted cupin superfamily sugar epimerase
VGRFSAGNDETYAGTDQGTLSCLYSGTLVISSGDLNIFQLAHDVEELHSCQYISTNHTGFASVVSLNGVDTLVYAFANGTYGFFAIMEKI